MREGHLNNYWDVLFSVSWHALHDTDLNHKFLKLTESPLQTVGSQPTAFWISNDLFRQRWTWEESEISSESHPKTFAMEARWKLPPFPSSRPSSITGWHSRVSHDLQICSTPLAMIINLKALCQVAVPFCLFRVVLQLFIKCLHSLGGTLNHLILQSIFCLQICQPYDKWHS